MKNDMVIIFFVLALSLFIGWQWDNLDVVREGVYFVLDPTFGTLIEWNNFIGFLIIVLIISLIFSLAQKFFTNQSELKKLKAEQKIVQKEMKKYKDHPEKFLELQKESMKSLPKMMHLSMRPIMYTGIPIILFFRWFQETLDPIYGGWWLLYYFIATVIFSGILRKLFKVH